MRRDMEDQGKGKENFEPGDEKCTSCSGIALFASKDARWTKDSTWCLGLKKSTQANFILPTYQSETGSTERKTVILIGNLIYNTIHEEPVYKLIRNTRRSMNFSETYRIYSIMVGHSISSKCMDRNEYPPIILLGTSLSLGTERSASSGKQPGPSIGNNESFVLSNENNAQMRDSQSTESVDEKSILPIFVKGTVLKVERMLKSGSIKQIKAMNNLSKKVFSRDFYNKFLG